MKISRVSSSLDPDHVQRFVGPDLGPNCLQGLSTADTVYSKSRVYDDNSRKLES